MIYSICITLKYFGARIYINIIKEIDAMHIILRILEEGQIYLCIKMNSERTGKEQVNIIHFNKVENNSITEIDDMVGNN